MKQLEIRAINPTNSSTGDKMSENNCDRWCVACGERFSKEQAEGAVGCPSCKNKGIPCSPKDDVSIDINWHELRILGMWASNWAGSFTEKEKDSKQALVGILGRLQRQFPDKSTLTMGGEVRDLRKSGVVENVETNIPREGFVIINGSGAVGHANRGET